MLHPGYRPIPISATMALNSWLMRESCCRNTLLQKHTVQKHTVAETHCCRNTLCRNTLLQKHHARELRTAGCRNGL